MLEIEKKYYLHKDLVVSDIEMKPYVPATVITQWYLYTSKMEELRIRKVNPYNEDIHQYFMTYKEGAGEIREEHEFIISSSMAESLIAPLTTKPLKKVRHRAEHEDHMLLVDIFTGIPCPYHKGHWLTLVEAEFEAVSDMQAFTPPSWVGDECTLSNKDLWLLLNENGFH